EIHIEGMILMEKHPDKKNRHNEHENHNHQDHQHVHNHADHGSHCHDHGSHGGHDHGDKVEDFKKRFFISLIVTILILALSPMIQQFIGVDWRFANDQYILFVLATFVFFYGGWPFIIGGIHELKDRNPGMMTLIGLAIAIAYVYSSLVVFGWEGH